jgi:hypothetical protein
MATGNGGSKLLSARTHRQIATIIRTPLELGKKNLSTGPILTASVELPVPQRELSDSRVRGGAIPIGFDLSALPTAQDPSLPIWILTTVKRDLMD